MSWLDQIKTQLSITTGDGQVYTPQWINAKRKVDFNIAKFEFPQVPGSLVDRREPKGIEYALEIYFQGTGLSNRPNVNGAALDYLVTSSAFLTSANDKRPWIIQHPFYGQLTVQPISIDIDNSVLNVSKIICQIIETITQDYPTGAQKPTDVISLDAITTAQLLATSSSNSDIMTKATAAISAKSINSLQSQLAAFQKAVAKAISATTADFQNYMNTFNQAYSQCNNLITDASDVLNLLQATINRPAMFAQTIQSRLTLLQGQFTTLESSISGSMSNLDKLLFTCLGGGCIGAMCLSCANLQTGDLIYSNDVLNTITQLLNFYNAYIADLDAIQTINFNSVNSYVADHDSLVQLEELINFTIGNLFNIALSGKQQRTLILEADSNWILLTHRLYGLDSSDANLATLMQQNNAGLNTIFIVEKNTKIYFYI